MNYPFTVKGQTLFTLTTKRVKWPTSYSTAQAVYLKTTLLGHIVPSVSGIHKGAGYGKHYSFKPVQGHVGGAPVGKTVTQVLSRVANAVAYLRFAL